MDDPLLVRRLEPLDDLPRDRKHFVEWHRTGEEALGERRPFDQLHHESAHVVSGFSRTFFEPVNRGDRRMIERGQQLRFAREPRDAVGVVAKSLRQDFDRHLAAQTRIMRAIDLPHSSGTEHGDDFVRTELEAGSEGHGCGLIIAGGWAQSSSVCLGPRPFSSVSSAVARRQPRIRA